VRDMLAEDLEGITMTLRIEALAAGAALAALLFVPSASAKPAIITFDAPDAGTASGTGTQAFAMNRQGDVAGTAYADDGVPHGFVRHADGSYLTFPSSGTLYEPLGINAHGRTAGLYQDENVTEGFVAKANGHAKLFQAEDDALYTLPEWIGDGGDVAGYVSTPGSIRRGFVRDKEGHRKVFDAPGAGQTSSTGTYAYGVDAHGTVAGFFLDAGLVYHGYLRAPDGTFTVITDPSAGTGPTLGTKIVTVNTSGEAAGYYYDSLGVTHGLVWNAGQITHFDVRGMGMGSGQGVHTRTINEKGAITGWSIDANGAGHGFVRLPNGKTKVFDPADAGAAKGQGTFSESIADNGAIAGFYVDGAGVAHGFIRSAK
jgi:hypothetical protein